MGWFDHSTSKECAECGRPFESHPLSDQSICSYCQEHQFDDELDDEQFEDWQDIDEDD